MFKSNTRHSRHFMVILFQGAPQLTENYLDSKKVRKAKYLNEHFHFHPNLHFPMFSFV